MRQVPQQVAKTVQPGGPGPFPASAWPCLLLAAIGALGFLAATGATALPDAPLLLGAVLASLATGWLAHTAWSTRQASRAAMPTHACNPHQALHDHAPDGILVFAADGRVLSANPAAARLLARPAEALVGLPLSLLLAGFEPTEAAGGMDCAVALSRPGHALAADGRAIPVCISVACWCDPAGQPTYAAIVRDATEQAIAQAELADAAQATLRQAEMFAGVTAVMAQGLVAWDHEGRLMLANPTYQTLLDLPDALVRPGTHYTDIVSHMAARGELGDGDILAISEARFAAAAGGRRSVIRRDNGRCLDIEHRPLEYNGFVTTVTDTTQERELQRALSASEERFRLLAENSGDVVMLSTLDGVRQYVSPASRRVLGWPPEQLMGRTALDLIHPEDREAARAGLARLAQAGSEVLISYRFRLPDRSWLWLDVQSRRFDHPSLSGPSYISVVRDASERRRIEEALNAANAELAEAAQTDTLTGLPNRRHFAAALEREWGRAAREQLPLSVAMIDIDHFKRFNDQYGHAAGDDCLRRVAQAALESARRVTDTVARWGGEEFILLMPNTDEAGSLVVAEGLRRAVQALGIAHEGNPGFGEVTCSIGLATIWPDREGQPQSQRAWLAEADEALYAAKHAGRNRVVQRSSGAVSEAYATPA